MTIIDSILNFGNIEKNTGQIYSKGFAPLVSPVGASTSIFAKMFGTSQTAVPGAVAKGGSIILPLAGGALAGFGLSSLLGGGSKKEVAQQAAPQSIAPIITPTATVQPNIITKTITNTVYNQQDYSQNFISGSPGASIKKSASAATSVLPNVAAPISTALPVEFTGEQGQTQSATQQDGTNMALLAGIAAVGLIGYGYVSKRKS